ncbi:RecBCD enzyme subunit RecB [subsurface metagenome]
MTVHRAKGTEFPVVFLPCLTSGKFPSSLTGRRGRWLLPRSLFSAARYEGCDDDERRLFYVGVTRSKRYLYLTHADQIEGLKRSCSPSTLFYSAKCSAMQDGAEVIKPLRLSKTSAPVLSRDTELNLSFSQLNSYLRCGWDYKFLGLLKNWVMVKLSTQFYWRSTMSGKTDERCLTSACTNWLTSSSSCPMLHQRQKMH